jgi:hypothetical protein
LSSDPLFVDIAGLYLSPPNRALVLSIDETWVTGHSNEAIALHLDLPLIR